MKIILFAIGYAAFVMCVLLFMSVGKKKMPKPPQKGNDG